MRVIFCALVWFGLPCQVLADGLAVAPGMWQSDSRIQAYRLVAGTRSPLPEVTASHSRCIGVERPELSASDLAGAGCEVTDVNRDSSSMSFVLTCRREEASFYGSMSAARLDAGHRAETRMELSGRRLDGSEIQIIAESEIRRTGACE